MCRAFITVILLATNCSFCCTAQAQQSDFPRLKQYFADNFRISVFAEEQLGNRILVPDTLLDGSQESVFTFLETQFGIRHLFYNSRVIILYSGSMQPVRVGDSQDEIFKVSGHLLDARTGANIVDGTIMVPDANLLVNTDPSGYFEFELPEGRYHIKALGQGTFASNFELVLDSHRSIDIELFEKTVELEEVIVSGTADDVNVVNLQPGSVTMQIDELKKVPAFLGEVDVSRAVISLPGVSTVGEGATGFNVRGGNIDQNLVLMDGMTLFNSSHLLGFFSVFNPDLLSDFTLYKGLIPADKGGRISSVLDVQQQSAGSRAFDLSASVGPVNSKLYLNLPIVKEVSGVSIGLRGAYPNYILRSFPDESLVSKSKASYFDVTTKYHHQFSSGALLSFDAYVSGDEFKLTADTTFTYSNLLLGLKYLKPLSEKWQLNLGGFVSRYHAGLQDRTLNQQANFDNGISQYSVNTSLAYQSTRVNHLLGAEINYYQFNTGELKPETPHSEVTNQVLPDLKALETSFYASSSVRVNHNIGVQAGLRATIFSNIGPQQILVFNEGDPMDPQYVTDTINLASGELSPVNTGFEPRVSLNYRLASDASLKMGYSRTYQYVHLFSNTVASLPTDLWRPSDRNLQPAAAHIFSLGYYKNWKENLFETSLEAFYKEMENIVDFTSGTGVLMNPDLVFNTIQGKAKAYGVELMIKKTRGKFTGTLAYTFSRAKSRYQSTNPEKNLNEGQYFPANFDRPHDLSLFGNYRLGRRWNAAANFVYTSGRPISLPQSSFRFAGAIGYTDIFRNNFRLPDFHRLDLSVTLEGSNKKGRKLQTSWTFSVFNVYGRKNVFSVFIDSEDGRPRQLSVLGAPFPSLTFNVKLDQP